jgi:hypothetical protein
MNAIASGKHDSEIKQCLSDAIEDELLAMNASLVLGKAARNHCPHVRSGL